MPCGSTRSEYVPDAGSFTVSSRPPLRPISTGWPRPTIPSFIEQHVDVPTVTPLAFTATRWPAEPEKETTAFWPGTEPAETVTGEPPGAAEADASGGTSYSVSVTDPTFMPDGSTRTEYVPSAGSTFVSTKAPFVPNSVCGTRPATDTVPEQQVELPIVEPLTFRLTRCPASPLKEKRAFWPGTGPVVRDTGGPPGEIEPDTSGGTS